MKIIENPGIYVGESMDGGILITGPTTLTGAMSQVERSILEKSGLVVIYKSWNGEVPVLELIMEILLGTDEE